MVMVHLENVSTLDRRKIGSTKKKELSRLLNADTTSLYQIEFKVVWYGTILHFSLFESFAMVHSPQVLLNLKITGNVVHR